MKIFNALAAAALVGLLATPAQAVVDVNGVKFEETAELQGAKLQLNGAGTRYKAIFKVYAAGLYLSTKASTSDEVVNAPGPKRLTITILRGIEANAFGKLLTRGIEDNMGKAEMSKLIPGPGAHGRNFRTFRSRWCRVTTSRWNGSPDTAPSSPCAVKVQGAPFKEPEFFKALMSIWLGPSPADYKLKEALLGAKPGQ
ncbi:MAG: chalcone isomerase family protein [Rhodoferax sp.]|nr:chalcone isomerase family protein [Rhodoferax sp.]